MTARSYERKPIAIELHGSIARIEGFSLLDLSQSGALIESSENLKIGNEYLINFMLPEGEHVPVKARVIRCTLVGSQKSKKGAKLPDYEIGLQFLEHDKEQLKKLSYSISKEERKTT